MQLDAGLQREHAGDEVGGSPPPGFVWVDDAPDTRPAATVADARAYARVGGRGGVLVVGAAPGRCGRPGLWSVLGLDVARADCHDKACGGVVALARFVHALPRALGVLTVEEAVAFMLAGLTAAEAAELASLPGNCRCEVGSLVAEFEDAGLRLAEGMACVRAGLVTRLPTHRVTAAPTVLEPGHVDYEVAWRAVSAAALVPGPTRLDLPAAQMVAGHRHAGASLDEAISALAGVRGRIGRGDQRVGMQPSTGGDESAGVPPGSVIVA